MAIANANANAAIFWKNKEKPTKTARIRSRGRTPKILGKQAKNAQKTFWISLKRKKQGNPKRQGKEEILGKQAKNAQKGKDFLEKKKGKEIQNGKEKKILGKTARKVPLSQPFLCVPQVLEKKTRT